MNSLCHVTRVFRAFATAIVPFFILTAVPSQGQIPVPSVLYHFQAAPTDADFPAGAIAQGRDGNLYGSSQARGANGTGGVWFITPTGVETLLASFPSTYSNCNGLTLGMDGNFYGACVSGGANSLGLIFKVTSAGVLTDLHDFDNTAGDYTPTGAPVLGPDGNLYGSTLGSCGNIYRISTAAVYKNLLTLNGSSNVCLPSVLTFGSDGNLYGAASVASTTGNRGGVFRISTTGVFKLLYGFVDATGWGESSGVILGKDGQLYGTTSFGGANGNGDIYKVTPTGVITDLLNINSVADGADNGNNLLQASNGNFYGASAGGGVGNQGALYELTSSDVFSVYLLQSATNTTLGDNPTAPLTQHTNGTLFGTTYTNGSSDNSSFGAFFSLNINASPFISLVTPVAAGKETTQVGILGQGFSSTSVVKFGGTAATKKTLTGSTFILATVPAGALTGKVTVTTGSTTLSTAANYKITPTIASFTPSSGAVGSSVTITGTGLMQATVVAFNKVSATFTVNSDMKITATVPTGATTGKISVTTTGGTATSAQSFTVN